MVKQLHIIGYADVTGYISVQWAVLVSVTPLWLPWLLCSLCSSAELQLQLSCLSVTGYVSCAVGSVGVSYIDARAGSDWNSFVVPLIAVFPRQLQLQSSCSDAIRRGPYSWCHWIYQLYSGQWCQLHGRLCWNSLCFSLGCCVHSSEGHEQIRDAAHLIAIEYL